MEAETSVVPAAPEAPYDSRAETLKHIARVQQLLSVMHQELKLRGQVHDQTKLEPFEKSYYDEFTPHGSPEYLACLAAMKPGIEHHYQHNTHHPEHYPDGIRGMTLLDLCEMFCDWKAATERHADGDLGKSIAINQKRFGYSDELRQIFVNTGKAYGWIEAPKLVQRTVNVNGEEHAIVAEELYYEDVAALAGLDPERVYSCIYRGADKESHVLAREQSVRVEDGMWFSILDKSNA